MDDRRRLAIRRGRVGLAEPGHLGTDGAARRVVSEVIEEVAHLSGNLMYEAQTAVLMQEHGIKVIYTRDTDFTDFPF